MRGHTVTPFSAQNRQLYLIFFLLNKFLLCKTYRTPRAEVRGAIIYTDFTTLNDVFRFASFWFGGSSDVDSARRRLPVDLVFERLCVKVWTNILQCYLSSTSIFFRVLFFVILFVIPLANTAQDTNLPWRTTNGWEVFAWLCVYAPLMW